MRFRRKKPAPAPGIYAGLHLPTGPQAPSIMTISRLALRPDLHPEQREFLTRRGQWVLVGEGALIPAECWWRSDPTVRNTIGFRDSYVYVDLTER